MNNKMFWIVMFIATILMVNCASAHGNTAMKITKDKVSGMHTMQSQLQTITPVSTYNWAGYSVDGSVGSVTDVKGSWIVPTINTTTPDQFSSIWIGIDGDISSSVEQIGTEADTDYEGNHVYYAWYGFFPDSWGFIDMTISPGDRINAEASYANGYITLTLTDVTTNETFSVTEDASNYDRSSAEWIVEAPWCDDVLPLTNFNVTKFGNSYTMLNNTCKATISGQTGNIGAFSAINKLTMMNYNNQVKAQPSVLSTDGSSFSIQWLRAN